MENNEIEVDFTGLLIPTTTSAMAFADTQIIRNCS
jgi:hypothetical protein